jgi:hypothetical protein
MIIVLLDRRKTLGKPRVFPPVSIYSILIEGATEPDSLFFANNYERHILLHKASLLKSQYINRKSQGADVQGTNHLSCIFTQYSCPAQAVYVGEEHAAGHAASLHTTEMEKCGVITY